MVYIVWLGMEYRIGTSMLGTVKRWSTEHALALMDIAPCPRGRRQRAHDRMIRRLEMFGRVLARR